MGESFENGGNIRPRIGGRAEDLPWPIHHLPGVISAKQEDGIMHAIHDKGILLENVMSTFKQFPFVLLNVISAKKGEREKKKGLIGTKRGGGIIFYFSYEFVVFCPPKT